MPKRSLYHCVTEGIRITVRPSFLVRQSRPAAGHFVYAYAVRIENVGDERVQLLTRFWRIHDSVGEGQDQEVRGAGVVGEQPVIGAGKVYEYQSFCVLRSPSGHMEGHYELIRPDGTRFLAFIPRFELDATADADKPWH